MGDIADATINGDFDFFTGEYLGPGGGHPRSIHGRVFEKDFTRSKESAFRGVRHYIQYKTDIRDITPVVNAFIPDTTRSMKQKCAMIQQDFGAFVKWFIEYKTSLKK